jgi:hypothetical protein
VSQRLERAKEILPLLDLFAAGSTGCEVGLQPGRGLSRKEVLQVVLNASRRDVSLLMPPCFPCGQPAPGPITKGFTNWRLFQDLVEEGRSWIEFRKAGEIGEEETPGLGFTLALDTSGKMLPYHRFLPGSQLLVQELLDSLGGQMPQVTVECHFVQLL